jgi:hypothetical protein
LRDNVALVPAFDPRQPELLYRCPRCGTRYGAAMQMLHEPRPGTPRPSSAGPPGRPLPGLPAPAGRVEQIGRAVALVVVVLFCLALLWFAGDRR